MCLPVSYASVGSAPRKFKSSCHKPWKRKCAAKKEWKEETCKGCSSIPHVRCCYRMSDVQTFYITFLHYATATPRLSLTEQRSGRDSPRGGECHPSFKTLSICASSSIFSPRRRTSMFDEGRAGLCFCPINRQDVRLTSWHVELFLRILGLWKQRTKKKKNYTTSYTKYLSCMAIQLTGRTHIQKWSQSFKLASIFFLFLKVAVLFMVNKAYFSTFFNLRWTNTNPTDHLWPWDCQ